MKMRLGWVCVSVVGLAVCACGEAAPSGSGAPEGVDSKEIPFAADPCAELVDEQVCDSHPSTACGWIAEGAFQSCVSLFPRTVDESSQVLLVLPERNVTFDALSASPLTVTEKQIAERNRRDIVAAFRGEAAPDHEVDQHNSNYCGHGSRYEQIITLVAYLDYRNVYCGSSHCHDHLNMHYHPFSDHGDWRTCGSW